MQCGFTVKRKGISTQCPITLRSLEVIGSLMSEYSEHTRDCEESVLAPRYSDCKECISIYTIYIQYI